MKLKDIEESEKRCSICDAVRLCRNWNPPPCKWYIYQKNPDELTTGIKWRENEETNSK